MLKREGTSNEIETVIGPSVHVEGDFVAVGDIVIEGTVSGKLRTENNLRIGENAKIFANVSAANILIAGEVQGNIKVKDSLELTGSARVFGDIKANTLTIAPGAILHGRCQSGEEKKSKLEKIDDKEKKLVEPLEK